MKVIENRRDIGKEDLLTVRLRYLCRMIGYLERSTVGLTQPSIQFLQAYLQRISFQNIHLQLYVTQISPQPLDLTCFSYLNNQQPVILILEILVGMPDVVLPI